MRVNAIGRVVILNGTTSAGKSTLIDAFCTRRVARGELWLRTALDDYMGKMPSEFFDVPGFQGRFGTEGFRLVERAGHVAFDVGPTAQHVLGAYRRTVATLRINSELVLLAVVGFGMKEWQGGEGLERRSWMALLPI